MPETPKEFDGFAIGGHDDGISVSGGLVSSPPPRPDAHLMRMRPIPRATHGHAVSHQDAP